MKQPIIEPSTPILIAETQSSVRKLLSDVFKELGYQNVQAVDTLKTVLSYLEKNQTPWIISPLHLEEEVNALQFLALVEKEPSLRRTFLSLLIDESELEFGLFAFAQGAVSWHSKEMPKDSLLITFKEFLETWNSEDHNSLTVATSYLQSLLKKTEKHGLRVSLLENLIEQYPQQEDWILELAKAQFDAAQPEKGLKTLGRAKTMGLSGWEPLASKHLAQGETLEWKASLRKVIIIEKDTTSLSHLSNIVGEFCQCEILKCETAEAALEELQKNPDIDCILMEWKHKNFSGPQLLQRIRSIKTHALTPLIVTSSLLNRQDSALLTEMSVSGLLEKPIQKDELSACFFNTLAEAKNPTQFRAIETEMLRCFQNNDIEGAEALAIKFWHSAEGTASQCYYISALFAFNTGQYTQASFKAREAFGKGGEPLKSINLLGQCCMRLGDYIGAVKCFKKAQEYSPKNIERLCNLSKALDELGEEKEAEAALESAKQVDASADIVVALETTNALEDGDIERAKELMQHAGNIGQLVSDLNSTGIAYTRAGEPEEGISFYEKTLEAIPPENTEWVLKVTYNLALAYARQDKLDAAYDLLTRSQLNDTYPVAGKMRSLMQRLKRSLDTGATFVIQPSARPEGESAMPVTATQESPWEKSLTEMENIDNMIPKGKIRPGQYGCAKIFDCPADIAEKCTSYLIEIPAFRLSSNNNNSSDYPEVS